MKHILAFSGSLRKNSINSGLVRAAVALASGSDLEITLADISALPLFNQDLEANYPKEIQALKDRIKAADGVLIATPEFNRSLPGALKNMFDWTSRPYGDKSWSGKPVAVVGATGGSLGTGFAQTDVRKILIYLNARVMGQPEFYVGGAGEKFDAAGNLTDEKTKERLKRLLDAFGKFI